LALIVVFFSPSVSIRSPVLARPIWSSTMFVAKLSE